MLKVLHITDSLNPAAGGPARTVTNLTDALALLPGMNIEVLSQGLKGEATVASTNPLVSRRVLVSNSALALRLGVPTWLALSAWPQSTRPGILHGHGVWTPVNHWTARAASRWSIPLIVHPRGMLEPWAVNQKALKKQLALALYQRCDLAAARVLVATAPQEFENLRSLGLRQPVAIIPNGVHLESTYEHPRFSKDTSAAPRTALFLSRIQSKKGLLNLIGAWGQLRPNGWRLQIAGPDEGGHLAEVLARVQQENVGATVEYVGPVDGDAKTILFRNADLFVLPSFSENFGVVVAEALANGLPVITTHGAPWQDLETYNCGWWIEIGVAPLVVALRTALALSDVDRHAMGERGRCYVQRYNWDEIATQTAALYRWVLGQGEQPACVHTT